MGGSEFCIKWLKTELIATSDLLQPNRWKLHRFIMMDLNANYNNRFLLSALVDIVFFLLQSQLQFHTLCITLYCECCSSVNITLTIKLMLFFLTNNPVTFSGV